MIAFLFIISFVAMGLVWAWKVIQTLLWFARLYAALRQDSGFVDVNMLSNQEKMELMVIGIEGKEQFCDDGKFLDVCKWKGVDCDVFGLVTSVTWNNHAIDLEGGYIELSRIPHKVSYFNVQSQGLNGSLIVRTLPRHMSELYLTSNRFKGQIDLSKLPDKIKDVYLGDNFFSGPINMQGLPATVEFLILKRNRIKQETLVLDDSLKNKSLCRIDLTENNIGEIFNSLGVKVHERCIEIKPKLNK